MQRQFTSNEVIVLTGITARQLQWWDERGIVIPERQGHRRIYAWDELVTVAVICQLRRRGFSLQRVRKVILPSVITFSPRRRRTLLVVQ